MPSPVSVITIGVMVSAEDRINSWWRNVINQQSCALIVLTSRSLQEILLRSREGCRVCLAWLEMLKCRAVAISVGPAGCGGERRRRQRRRE